MATVSSPSYQVAAGLIPVAPTRPVAGYIGGKRNLAKRIVERISAISHTTYAEPFVGMGGIFLRRTFRPQAEVINDWSADVATFFRILQRHYVAFMDMLRFELTTRSRFEELLRTDPTTLTDLERSARFLYLQRTTFGGKVAGRSFGVSPTTGARFDITKLGPLLEAAHERLAPVVIERLAWADFITRYDRPGTLFYLDPPYYGSEKDYVGDDRKPLFERSQFEQMAELLGTIRGRFLLSINDHPDVRHVFRAFDFEEVETTYQLAGMARPKRVGELIISGGGGG
ncbi:MAG: DNA adenine methylase [Sphingomonadales bacterium]|nr:DNA adenine methylase [Sphingomonadales bacterium]